MLVSGLTLAALGVAGCGDGHPPAVPMRVQPPICATGAGVYCDGGEETTCDADGAATGVRQCAPGDTCRPGLGCTSCTPGVAACDGETPIVCGADGNSSERLAPCDTARSLHCSPLGCRDLCADAVAARSYLGCEYWATSFMNTGLPPPFTFAVVVSNPQDVPAEVIVDRVDHPEGEPPAFVEVTRAAVTPGGLATIALPWINSLRDYPGSIVASGGAYRVRASVPVNAYQFNALEYLVTRACVSHDLDRPEPGVCFSHTNDASLLVPVHALTESYVAVSVQPSGTDDGWSPAFIGVVAVSDRPTHVELRLRGDVQASTDVDPVVAVPAARAGEVISLDLERGDVLQLASARGACDGVVETVIVGGIESRVCRFSRTRDLTGTEIRTSEPAAAFSGHNCAFVPFDRFACDHLEEQLLPLESWGRAYVVGRTQPLREGEPNVVRVVSGADGNDVAFDPPVHEPAHLDRGDFVELEAREDFQVSGSQPLSVAQFLVGQLYLGAGAGFSSDGDPSMGLVVPTEQFRADYSFLSPLSYRQSFVTVVAPSRALTAIDGTTIIGLEEIGTTGYASARVPITPGAHRMTGTAPFGVSVYGFGAYTSYLYPAGLDLNPINPPF